MILIRKAKISDFDAIFDLCKQLWEAELPFDSNIKKDYYETEEAKKEVLKAIRARKKLILVAEKFIKLNVFRENEQAVSLYEKENFNEYSLYYIKKL